MSVYTHMSVCMSVCCMHACAFVCNFLFYALNSCDGLLGVSHKEAVCHEGCNANIGLR